MYTAAVITVSDRAYNGTYHDESGPAVAEMLRCAGYDVLNAIIIPDKNFMIAEALIKECEKGISLVVTTGGTGFAPRDLTPEATRAVIEREAPGIAEYMRMQSAQTTPRAILSRGIAGIRGTSLIINLPGSPRGAVENLGYVLPYLDHGLDMLNGMKE
jgi:molybdenum cofactor synthesis domain-containing protein